VIVGGGRLEVLEERPEPQDLDVQRVDARFLGLMRRTGVHTAEGAIHPGGCNSQGTRVALQEGNRRYLSDASVRSSPSSSTVVVRPSSSRAMLLSSDQS
jgi:hypothetical protein